MSPDASANAGYRLTLIRSELIGPELYSCATMRLVARRASMELDSENLFSGFIDNADHG